MNNPQTTQGGLVNVRFLGVLGAVLFAVIAAAYIFYGLQPAAAEGVPVPFKIMKGEGFREIGAHLSQNSLIKSIAVFKFYALLTGHAQRFQPGAYELSPMMSIPQIVNELTVGGRADILVTIPEGSTVKDVDALIAAAGIRMNGTLATLTLSSFAADYPFLSNVSSFEGFLFPDSYYFPMDTSPNDVARRMLDNFMKKAWPMLAEANGWYNKLILASFLEREVSEFADRQLVAGILLKRAQLGMPLQVDATLSYAKCGGQFYNCASVQIARTDTRLTSPYNTYQRLGWTPTPIANPGEVAIRAALSPTTSPYLYYLSASADGKTYFSRTLDEHNIKRAKYL